MDESDHLDPTLEIDLETVKKRSVKGIVVLTGRTFVLNILSLFATALLTVFLTPEQFGVFWITSAAVNFLAYFSDVGLAAALIQKKEKLNHQELVTTFSVQESMIAIIALVSLGLYPLLLNYYHLSFEGIALFYAFVFSLVLSSLKTIPSVLLERKLEFGKLVIPQVLENISYNLIAVYCAWRGLGITSFTLAVIGRAIIGVVVLWYLKRWKIGFGFDKKSFKALLKYGVPYQVNTFLATLKDDGVTAILGGVLGPYGVGLLGWAQKWGQAPLRFFMDHVIKVTFPAFSRLQDNKAGLKRGVERSIFFVSFLVFPSLLGLIILSPTIISLVPRYEKWSPALLPLMLIGVNTIFASVTTPITNLLNAIGKIKITFYLMIMWTVLTYVIILPLAIIYGVKGASFGYAILGLSSIIAIIIAKKYVDFSLKPVIKPIMATIVMSGVVYTLNKLLPVNFSSLWITIAVGIVSYLLSSFVLIGSSLLTDFKTSSKALVER